MDIVSGIAPVVVPVLVATGAGYVWGRLRQPFDHFFVTKMITHIGAPCLVFSALVQVPVSNADMGGMALAALGCLVLFAVLGALGLKLAGLSQRTFLPSLVFPNIGNIGLPVCLFAFGKEGLALAMVYFTLCTTLQFTLGEAIAAGRFRLSAIFQAPFVYAAVAATIVNLWHLTPPAWLINSTALLGGMAVPLMLLALGVALAELRVTHLPRASLIAVARLALGLAGGLALAWVFDLHGTARGVLLIQSTMPVAVFNYLFAKLYGNAPEEVAGAVVVSTLLSYLTLPFTVFAATLPL
jgi:hypothetical protein